MKNKLFAFAFSLCFTIPMMAQSGPEGTDTPGGEGINPHSTRPIHSSDIMWQKRVVRALDLREKQNEPLFSKNKEFTKILLEAVKAGELKPYTSDSLDAGMMLTLENFINKLVIPGTDIEIPDWPTDETDDIIDDGWPDDIVEDDDETLEDEIDETFTEGPEYYMARDLYQIEMTEDLIFDKERSQMRYDIQSITLYIPADHPLNEKGIQEAIATFSYKDIVNILKNNSNAIWYNRANDAEHRSLVDAFDLRLFNSYIVKVSNPNDDWLIDAYGGDERTGIMAAQWEAYNLLEFEHNLWEF